MRPSPTKGDSTPWTALVVSVAPEIGDRLPGTSDAPTLRQYSEVVEAVRLLYFVTALRTAVVVAHIEV